MRKGGRPAPHSWQVLQYVANIVMHHLNRMDTACFRHLYAHLQCDAKSGTCTYDKKLFWIPGLNSRDWKHLNATQKYAILTKESTTDPTEGRIFFRENGKITRHPRYSKRTSGSIFSGWVTEIKSTTSNTWWSSTPQNRKFLEPDVSSKACSWNIPKYSAIRMTFEK